MPKPFFISIPRQVLAKRRFKEVLSAFILISVAVLLNFSFGYFATFFAFYLSFFEWDYIGPMKFVGLKNYQIMLNDILRGISGAPYFLAPFFTGLRNILLYTAIVVPTQTVLALILAVIANQMIRGIQLYRVSYFLPSVTCPVIISLIFVWLFMKNGFINWLIQFVVPGFAPDWINDGRYLLYAISMVAIWGTSSHFMVTFLAALQSIPRDLYEAATLDGANRLKRFLYITLPLLKPAIVYVVVMGLIGALQMFDLAWVMAGSRGGPGGAGYTMALDIYNEAFVNLRPGVAAAKSIFLFALIFVITYFVQKRLRVMRL